MTAATPRSEGLAGDLAGLWDPLVESGGAWSRSQEGEWDQFVRRVGGDVVQTTAWAAAKRALGFEVIPVRCRDRNGALSGGAQLVVKHMWWWTVAYIARGPVLHSASADRADAVLEEIERSARARGVRQLIIQPPPGQLSVQVALPTRGFVVGGAEVAPAATLRLDLRQDVKVLEAGMSASRRRQTRRAERAGLEAALGTADDLEAFHRLHAATAAAQGFRPLALAYLESHWQELKPLDAVQLVLVKDRSRPIAGIWLTTFGDTVTFRIAGWNRELAAAYPNVAAHWFAIRWAKARGFRYYDLGGLPRRYAEALLAEQPVSPDMLESAARFKVAFGGRPQILPGPWHLTFNPIARVVVRSLTPRLSQGRLWRALLARVRSG